MAIERISKTVWEGDLLKGSGNIEFVSSGLPITPVTWASRTESPDGRTSPEELLAAAHAACFSMALSATLGRSRKTPEKLAVTARCVLDRVGEGYKVTDMHLTVEGEVPDLTEVEFKDLAAKAEQGCPISNALRNNVRIHLEARLK